MQFGTGYFGPETSYHNDANSSFYTESPADSGNSYGGGFGGSGEGAIEKPIVGVGDIALFSVSL